MGDVGAEARGDAAGAAADVQDRMMGREVREEEGGRVGYGAFGVGRSDGGRVALGVCWRWIRHVGLLWSVVCY